MLRGDLLWPAILRRIAARAYSLSTPFRIAEGVERPDGVYAVMLAEAGSSVSKVA